MTSSGAPSSGIDVECTLHGLTTDGHLSNVEACEAIGLPFIPDLNAPQHPPFGCGKLHFTISPRGTRNSAYDAFVPKDLAIARRHVLHVCTNTTVAKLETTRDGDGLVKVTGVHLLGKKGETRLVRVKKEVVLSAGPFGSPRVLMLRFVLMYLVNCMRSYHDAAGLVRRIISKHKVSILSEIYPL